MKTKILNLLKSNELLLVIVCSILFYPNLSNVILFPTILLLLQQIKDYHTVDVILYAKKKSKNLKSIDLKRKSAVFFENKPKPIKRKSKRNNRLKEVA